MLVFAKKLFYTLGNPKYQLLGLVLAFLIISVLDTMGIGLVGPFVLLSREPQSIHQHQWLLWLYQEIGFNSESDFVIGFGLAIIAIFLLKSFAYFYMLSD
jgi:ATP-binding cassette, subfamily B, bacterial PglK